MPAFQPFLERFQARFSRVCSFGSAYGYEAVLVLAAALKRTGGKAEGLREALLQIHDLQGPVDTFSCDKKGDVVRNFYIGAVQDGQIVPIKVYKPALNE